MADKNFKVKTGLDLPAPLPVEQGGTGQTSTVNTLNSLLPVQSDNDGKFLVSNGINVSWGIPNYSEVSINGVPIEPKKTLNFIGATVENDSSNNRTNISISGGSSLALVVALEH
jgi:hypothetical protein